MKRFYCRCGQEVFFENMYCSVCDSQLGFVAEQQAIFSLTAQGDKWAVDGDNNRLYRSCEHRDHELQCNWLIPEDSSANQCISCALTRTIPVLDRQENWRRWRTLESSKRRMLYGLLRLKLPLNPMHQGYEGGLVFDFLEDQRTNPTVSVEHIYSGHANGVITLNAAEADSSYREATREAMNEPYRTLLGHFRHEVGHFYWDQFIKDKPAYSAFKQLFGDDTVGYRESVDNYYQNGPRENWQQDFISAYASAHPLEDWAETWSHYLLMMETLETAFSFGLIPKMEKDWYFDIWMSEWMQLVVVVNALNRSTGSADAYPFVISSVVKNKLKFVHELILNLN